MKVVKKEYHSSTKGVYRYGWSTNWYSDNGNYERCYCAYYQKRTENE